MEVGASVLAVIEISARVASLLFQYANDVKNAKGEILRLQQEVRSMQDICESIQKLLQSPKADNLKASRRLFDALNDGFFQLRRLELKIEPGKTRATMKRAGITALRWPLNSRDIEKTVKELGRCMQLISLALQVDQTNILLGVHERLDALKLSKTGKGQSDAAGKLPFTKGAAFNSPTQEIGSTCLENTRTAVLEKIYEWANNQDAETMFWLNGMAGTGKSTISRTVAKVFAERGLLGASFFFKRGEVDGGRMTKFFTTIAAQLMRNKPALAPYIKNAINEAGDISEQPLRAQFEHLIRSPISLYSHDSSRRYPLVFVIDALDECDPSEHVKLMIDCISSDFYSEFVYPRFFVTSRPDLAVLSTFHAGDRKYRKFILHEVSEPVIEQDINTYLSYEFQEIKGRYNATVPQHRHLPSVWPGQFTLQELSKMASPLFIFASTICRFVADRKWGSPDEQLKIILKNKTRSQGSKLDSTYLPVLNQLLTRFEPTNCVSMDSSEAERLIIDYQLILGSVIVFVTPLSSASIAALLNQPEDWIDSKLDFLHSVLSVPAPPDPVRLMHLSFRDFLLDPAKRGNNRFWIDEKHANEMLAMNCIRRMRECLKRDIYSSEIEGKPLSERDLENTPEALPAELQYACRQWVYHLELGDSSICKIELLYDFLRLNFLYWLEVLAILRVSSECLNMIDTVQNIIKSRYLSLQDKDQLGLKTLRILSDAQRFVLANRTIIHSDPLQIYNSALIFAPESSILRHMFRHDMPQWISLLPQVDHYWGRCMQMLEVRNFGPTCIAFSQDSTLIASAANNDAIRIWEVTTGECLQAMESLDNIVSIAFSPDSTQVASASSHNSVRVWQLSTGDYDEKWGERAGFSQSSTFSYDIELFASATDHGIFIWSVQSGKQVQFLEAQPSKVRSIAFSEDNVVLATGSVDCSVCLWAIESGKCLLRLRGHEKCIYSVSFSSDSRRLATASGDKTVRIWSVDTGECIRILNGHEANIYSVSFSRDMAFIISSSGDESIWIWDAATGECVDRFSGQIGCVVSAIMSHDLSLLASISLWETSIRIWAACLDKRLLVSGDSVNRGHKDVIHRVILSENTALVASLSVDCKMQVWSMNTGKCIYKVDISSLFQQHTTNSHEKVSMDDLLQRALMDSMAQHSKTVASFGMPVLKVVEEGPFQYGFGDNGRWITCNDKNLIWLPFEYRPIVEAISGPAIISGCRYGKVLIMRFSSQKLPKYYRTNGT